MLKINKNIIQASLANSEGRKLRKCIVNEEKIKLFFFN